MQKTYILKVTDDSVFSPIYYGSFQGDNGFVAQQTLLSGLQAEINDDNIDLECIELLEFPIMNDA